MNRLIQFFRECVWAAIPAEVTPRQRRIAALAWPGFLIFVAALTAWRRLHHQSPLGIAPILLAFLAPVLGISLLAPEPFSRAVYLWIMRFFATFGFVVSHAFLTLFFYLIVTPLAMLLRLSGKDLIDRANTSPPSGSSMPQHPRDADFIGCFESSSKIVQKELFASISSP